MKIINRSRIPTRKLRTLLNFATRNSKYHDLGVLIVQDGSDSGFSTGGMCHYRDPDPDTYNPLTPSAIYISVGHGLHYPRIEQFRKSLPPTEMNSIEEDILLVIAHEIEHLNGWWRWRDPDDDYRSEMQAERYALSVLSDWKNR